MPSSIFLAESSFDDSQAHTWATNLTSFQIEKFTYMFNQLFDLDKNNLIEEKDMRALADKMREYAGWGEKDETYSWISDVQMIFLECLQDQVKKEMASQGADDLSVSWKAAVESPTSGLKVTSISLRQWLNMWGRLCYGAAGLGDFPIWVQMLPKIFFEVIDQDKDGVLSQQEYTNFYSKFVGVPSQELDKVVREGYRAMTANGDYKLTLENFGFVFANFLLGRSIYGPGKYIFGVFDNRDINEAFAVCYNDEDEE